MSLDEAIRRIGLKMEVRKRNIWSPNEVMWAEIGEIQTLLDWIADRRATETRGYRGDSLEKLLADMRVAVGAARNNRQESVALFVAQWIERLQGFSTETNELRADFERAAKIEDSGGHGYEVWRIGGRQFVPLEQADEAVRLARDALKANEGAEYRECCRSGCHILVPMNKMFCPAHTENGNPEA
jgi:hypothetical protein